MARITLGLICAALLAGCSALPERSSERRTSVAAPSPSRAVPAPINPATGQCLSKLGRSGASYARSSWSVRRPRANQVRFGATCSYAVVQFARDKSIQDVRSS